MQSVKPSRYTGHVKYETINNQYYMHSHQSTVRVVPRSVQDRCVKEQKQQHAPARRALRRTHPRRVTAPALGVAALRGRVLRPAHAQLHLLALRSHLCRRHAHPHFFFIHPRGPAQAPREKRSPSSTPRGVRARRERCGRLVAGVPIAEPAAEPAVDRGRTLALMVV